MTSSRQSAYRSAMFGRLLAASAAILLAGSSLSRAEVMVTADPEYPVFPGAFTLDPEQFSPAARGIAGDRNLRQTFTNTQTFDVSGLVLSLDINDVAGGLDVELFEVDDVLAAEWNPGNLVTSFSLGSNMLVETSQRLGIDLTGSDVFTLPARTAPAGYGIQLSNIDNTTNIGVVRHSNSGTDEFSDGIFYDESGTPPTSYRDFGVALVNANVGEVVPGDVNGDSVVDTADLDIITANFRQGPATRSSGDLTGDAIVDLFDFRAWKDNFPGAFPASFRFGSQVPEPGTIWPALLAIGACGSLLRHRRRS